MGGAMTLFELLFFALLIYFSISISRPLIPYIGWWAVAPAIAVSYGIVRLLYLGLGMFLDRVHRDVRPGQQSKD